MGTQHTYRVIVRGAWEGLTEAGRAALLAAVDEHDGLAAIRFTEEGSLAYDRALRRFTYRFVVVSDAADGEEMAEVIAEDRARAALAALGHGHGELKCSATDMDTMKINDKGRRKR